MIRIVDTTGVNHYIAVQNIARLTEAESSLQWQGIRCIVRTFDGAVIEISETAHELQKRIEAAAEPPKEEK